MKRKKRTFFPKKWKDKFLKTKWLTILFLTAGGILLIILLGLNLKVLIERRELEIKKELEEISWQFRKRPELALPERDETITPEILYRLKKEGVERFFLSKVEVIGIHFTPTIHACLYKEGRPIYPLYVYGTWSHLSYPERPPPQIILIRYLLLPEDNPYFRPDRNCFIKEIKTERDWQELQKKYGFFREQF